MEAQPLIVNEAQGGEAAGQCFECQSCFELPEGGADAEVDAFTGATATKSTATATFAASPSGISRWVLCSMFSARTTNLRKRPGAPA